MSPDMDHFIMTDVKSTRKPIGEPEMADTVYGDVQYYAIQMLFL